MRACHGTSLHTKRVWTRLSQFSPPRLPGRLLTDWLSNNSRLIYTFLFHAGASMPTVHLIDTPKRSALAAHSANLRTKLKQWEKSFAASHSGQKPGKEDIKACLEIAKTYKEYNRVRDVLDGKL